jgi:hypothetical protein
MTSFYYAGMKMSVGCCSPPIHLFLLVSAVSHINIMQMRFVRMLRQTVGPPFLSPVREPGRGGGLCLSRVKTRPAFHGTRRPNVVLRMASSGI